jgi:small subunit ribosomal protein S8
MAVTDPIGDLLTRIRNAQRQGSTNVSSPASHFRMRVLDVLAKEGYIRGYSQSEPRPGLAELSIELKYHEGQPVIRDIARISKPGRRVYYRVKEMPRYFGGLGIAIVSTSRGIMSDGEARAANVGGEVLCRVF